MILYSRQFALFNPTGDPQPTITVVGAGTIGSWTTLFLCKEGFKEITVFDHDIVEEHNIPNQLYGEEWVGRLKVEALQSIVEKMTSIKITAIPSRASTIKSNIVILAVDSMKARKKIVEDCIAKPPAAIIDGRVGGNVFEIFCASTNNMETYISTIIPDDTSFQNEEVQNAFNLKCTERSIADVSVMCAAQIVNIVRLFVTKLKLPRFIRYDGFNHIFHKEST